MNQTQPPHTSQTDRLVRLDGVSKTLMIPLFARALATELLANVPFTDSHAQDVIASSSMGAKDVSRDLFPMRLCVARSYLLEQQLSALQHTGTPRQVVLLACGLDTLPQRTNDPNIKWICADLAPVIETRQTLLPPAPNITHLALSLPQELDSLAPHLHSAPPIVILEGILPYLSPQDVAQCFHTLAALCPQGADIITDSYHPKLLAFAEMGNTFKRMEIRFKFGLADPKEYETFSPRLALQESHSVLAHLPWYTKKRCLLPQLLVGRQPLATICRLTLSPQP